MIRKLMGVAVMMAAPAVQAAPLIDIHAGVRSWNAELDGTVADHNRPSFSLDGTLGFDKVRQTYWYVGLEHPVPALPNVRLAHFSLSKSERAQVANPIEWDGKVLSGTVSSELDLEFTDLTLYWSPLNNWVKLDLGVTLRTLSAELDMRSSVASAHDRVRQTLPMLHANSRFELPFTGFYAGLGGNAVSYDGSSLTDYTVSLGWRSDFLLGVEIGYTSMDLDLDDVSDVDADISVSGPYLAIALVF